MGKPSLAVFTSRMTVLVWLAALAGCKAAEDAALEEYAPRSEDAAIKAVSLGTSDTETFDPSRIGTEFPQGTERVVVWYRWDGAEKGTKVDVQWSMNGGRILDQGEPIDESSGEAAWFLMMGAGGPLPSGSYQVDLLENGVKVTSIPFRVGGA